MSLFTNTIGYGTIYRSSWVGSYTELNSLGYVNDYLFRVKSNNGIIENTKNLIDKVKKLFTL